MALVLIIVLLFRFNQVKRKNNDILKEKNAKISETLAINEILLKETHHRVKNNLQIVSSLLNMQSNFLKDENSKQIIEDSQNRIKSMSLIHQQLYQGKHITSVEISSYFAKLLDNLCLSYGINNKNTDMQISIENMLLDVDTAVPLGLILNELISNAFKHGINTENGCFSLIFRLKNKKELELIVKDNGKGFDNKKEKKASYGMKLIQILSKKLRAKIHFINDNGLEVRLLIKKFKIVR